MLLTVNPALKPERSLTKISLLRNPISKSVRILSVDWWVGFAFSGGLPTLHGLGVGLTAALAHRVQELVHLLERQRVVQRLQWVDRGHHRAAFKPCRRAGGGTQGTQTQVAPPFHQELE